MSTEPKSPETGAPDAGLDVYETANDRFKQSFGSWFWSSIMVATVVHFAVLAFWPNLEASDMTFTMDEITAIDIPPEIEIPPPPEQIQRPANPVVTDAQIDDDITIAPTTFEDNPIDDLPPPPTQAAVDISDQPSFTPFETAPEIRNRAQIQSILEREYPRTLRDAGVGGTVILHFFINDQGVVENTVVETSSGYPQLDAAAQRVAEQIEFTPALNRQEVVAVWIQLPITFETR